MGWCRSQTDRLCIANKPEVELISSSNHDNSTPGL